MSNSYQKNINTPNVTQARPIVNLWSCLAQKVYEGGWEAKTEYQLINRITIKLKKIDINFVETLMDRVKQKVKLIGQDGVFSLYKK